MKIREEKQRIRMEVKKRLSEYTKEWVMQESKKIQEHILQSEAYQKADTIFCYVSFEKEVDTMPILFDALRSGKRVGVPLCTGKGIMEVREIKSFDDLEEGNFGILEPGKETVCMEKDEIDYGIIPCVTCDESCNRLGHGAGYYDRYLDGTTFPKVLLCFEEIMAAHVPMDRYDIRMDAVVSQSGVKKSGAGK